MKGNGKKMPCMEKASTSGKTVEAMKASKLFTEIFRYQNDKKHGFGIYTWADGR
jgi:hypothetical protein